MFNGYQFDDSWNVLMTESVLQWGMYRQVVTGFIDDAVQQVSHSWPIRSHHKDHKKCFILVEWRKRDGLNRRQFELVSYLPCRGVAIYKMAPACVICGQAQFETVRGSGVMKAQVVKQEQGFLFIPLEFFND